MSLTLYVCLSVHAKLKNFSWFFIQEVLYPWLGPPLRWSGSGSVCGHNNYLNDYSPLWDRTKYDLIRTLNEKMRYNVIDLCVIHSEEGLDSDSPVYIDLTSHNGCLFLKKLIQCYNSRQSLLHVTNNDTNTPWQGNGRHVDVRSGSRNALKRIQVR